MTLTEQWKKGELERGWYYVYLKHLEMFDIAGSSTLSGILERGNENSTEVLAPIPSYEEWQTVFNYATKYEVEYVKCVNDYEELRKENQQLRALLKKCLDELQDFNNPSYPAVENLLTRINAAIGESEE